MVEVATGSFAELLKRNRVSAGLTQEELGDPSRLCLPGQQALSVSAIDVARREVK
jgi:hypothetical protein